MAQEEATGPYDPALFKLVCEAVKTSIAAIAALPKGTFIPEYYGWGKLAWFSSGLPHLEGYLFGGGPPKEYQGLFGDGNRFGGYPYSIQMSKIPAYKAVEAYLLSHNQFRTYEADTGWHPADDPDWHMKWRAKRLVTDVVDRWMHLQTETPPTDELILPLYMPLESPYFCNNLPIHIVVPLVCLNFGFEQIVGAEISVIKMSESFQMA